ncbi:SusC/RagA family TonB-linked outer membrane protein [Agriterribacter sp.]|uniref:SusC/RagA family TonB-linked outer membrane protein n=1 Tax=Agriterribacter sp. TaxID=2821509 RepID=UPI002BCCF655|nr:SusC/RagA family TonB-linked outer membrane protein [Agriterribacter sp.]HRP55175.1 SusC/RagA family TonB-linked outer membrane protein [Agriterribacter sp.]
MRLTVILVLAACFKVSAGGYAQQITLKVKDMPCESVFREITRQSGYQFFFNKRLIRNARNVSVELNSVPVEKAIEICFSGQPFDYVIINKTVVIRKKEHQAPVISDAVPASPLSADVSLSGRVTNAKEEPLEGVSVTVKGTQTGTTTDTDGQFRLSVPSAGNVELVFSFVGYGTQTVKAGSQTVFNIIMEEAVSDLADIVVIGYGTAKKSDLTGSVSHLDARAFQNQSMTQITDMLAGTTPGVYAIQSTGASGGGSIEIRGPSSLSAGTSPLIVLDGSIFNGSIRDINPNDVETIDILKDASSAAVFGAKSAAGVILITTKKGTTGKPTIDFSSKIGVATTTHDLKPFGPKGYLDMHRDYLTQVAGNTLPYGYYFNPDELPDGITIDQWRNFSANPAANNEDEWISRIGLFPIEIENYEAGKITDFYDLVIGPALMQDYSLGIGGGTKNLKYYFSTGYLNNKGVIKGDVFSTVRTRLNLDLKVTDWLNIGVNSQFASRDESVVPANLGQLAPQSPYGSMWNEDGTLRRRPNDYALNNPLENYYGQDRLNKINTFFSSLYANVKLPLGFKYKISFQPNLGFSKDYNFWSVNTTSGSGSHVGGFGTRSDASSYGWLLDQLLTWNKKIGIHQFDLTLLANAEAFSSHSSYQENSDFAPNGNLIYNALQFGSKPGVSDNDSYSSGDALMARLNYSLSGKYFLTATVRRDGYSAFGQQNPRATFPAFAFAWKISDESFYKISWMNQLKLRLSWGENGNRDIGAYTALAKLGSVLSYDGTNVQTGVYSSTLANYGLRWERTQATNVGLDIGLFKNRIDLTIDAYDATTFDLLMNRLLPAITGFSNVTTNLGELGNRGIDISINTVNIQNKNFNWRSGFTFSMNRNKIKKLWGDMGDYTLLGKSYSGELPDLTNNWFPGQSKDVVWNYDVTGVWQMEEKEAASKYGFQPGDWKADDVNDDGKYLQFEDKKFIGYTAPRYRLGLRNEFTFFRNWYASIFIRADLGHIRSMPFLTRERSVFNRTNTWSLPYWSPENPTNDYQRYVYPDNLGKYQGGLTVYKPTGFIRVQDVTLSYSVPWNIAQRVKLNSFRVFGSIRNFLTFTKWPGFDPESNMTPMPKVFTLGINLTL